MKLYDKPRNFAWTDFETTGLRRSDRAIEIAIIVTDEHLEELGRFQSLIKPNFPANFMTLAPVAWRKQCLAAYKVHKIDPSDVIEAPSARHVGFDLDQFIRPFGMGKNKPIMISDNPRFEDIMYYNFCLEAGQPLNLFHYNIWSPIMLTQVFGMPRPRKQHRAMNDVEGMLDHVRKAFDLLPEIKAPVVSFSSDNGDNWKEVPPTSSTRIKKPKTAKPAKRKTRSV